MARLSPVPLGGTYEPTNTYVSMASFFSKLAFLLDIPIYSVPNKYRTAKVAM